MDKPRLALIGCGKISEFHAPACREAGFELAAVCSRPGSTRLDSFAQRHDIPLVFDHVEALLEAREKWDALLIAISVEATLDVLTLALESGAPILVEKPVALRSAELLPIINRGLPVIVGYNRRFYRTTQEARLDVATTSPVMAHLSIPESIKTPHRTEENPGYLRPFFANSVHGLDLARYVFGELSVQFVQHIRNPSGAILGLAATLSAATQSAEGGSVVQLTANWGTPANFSLTLDRPGRRLELRPFESATVYEGMEVREPTEETPIRRYDPIPVARVDLDEVDRRFKPGFVAQGKALASLVRGEDTGPAARLEDAYAVLQLAEQLINYPSQAS